MSSHTWVLGRLAGAGGGRHNWWPLRGVTTVTPCLHARTTSTSVLTSAETSSLPFAGIHAFAGGAFIGGFSTYSNQKIYLEHCFFSAINQSLPDKQSVLGHISWNCAIFNFLCSTNKNNINKHFLPFKFALFYVLYNLEETCTFVAPPPTHPTYPPHPSTHLYCWEPSGSLRSAQVITIQRHQICLFYFLLVNHG